MSSFEPVFSPFAAQPKQTRKIHQTTTQKIKKLNSTASKKTNTSTKKTVVRHKTKRNKENAPSNNDTENHLAELPQLAGHDDWDHHLNVHYAGAGDHTTTKNPLLIQQNLSDHQLLQHKLPDQPFHSRGHSTLPSSLALARNKTQVQDWTKQQDELDASLRMVEQMSAQRNEITQLKSRIRAQNTEISSQQDALEQRDRTVQKLKHQLETDRTKYTAALDQLEREIEFRRDDEDMAKSFEATLKRLRKENAILKAELERNNDQVQSYRTESVQLREKLEKVANEMYYERSETKLAKTRLAAAAERELALKHQVEVMQRELESKEAEILSRSNEIAKLEEQVNKKESSHRQFQERMNQLEKLVLARETTMVAAATSEPTNTSTDVNQLQIEPSQQNQNAVSDGMHNPSDAKPDVELISLRRQLENQEVEISVLNQKIRTLKSERNHLQLKLQNQSDAHDKALSRAEDENGDIERLQDRLRAAEWKTVEAERKSLESKAESDRLLAELNNMKTSMEEVLVEMESMKANVEYLSQEREDAIQLIDSLESEIEQAHALRRLWSNGNSDNEEQESAIQEGVSPDDIASALCHLYSTSSKVSEQVVAFVKVVEAQLHGEPVPMHLLLGVDSKQDQVADSGANDGFQVPTLSECNQLVTYLKQVSDNLSTVKSELSDAYAEAVGNDCYVQ